MLVNVAAGVHNCEADKSSFGDETPSAGRLGMDNNDGKPYIDIRESLNS